MVTCPLFMGSFLFFIFLVLPERGVGRLGVWGAWGAHHNINDRDQRNAVLKNTRNHDVKRLKNHALNIAYFYSASKLVNRLLQLTLTQLCFYIRSSSRIHWAGVKCYTCNVPGGMAGKTLITYDIHVNSCASRFLCTPNLHQLNARMRTQCM